MGGWVGDVGERVSNVGERVSTCVCVSLCVAVSGMCGKGGDEWLRFLSISFIHPCSPLSSLLIPSYLFKTARLL